VQFTQLRKNVAKYLQHTALLEGYLVAETVRTGKKQVIALPLAVDESTADVEDQKIIRAEEVKTVAKRCLKFKDALKKGYATIYDQCSQEVKDKMEATDDWERIQREQSLHELIQKIERICIGFDDHKQEVFNLVQLLKMLFLHTQGEKEGVDQYARNFKSLWDTVEAFRGLPGVHRGLVSVLLSDPNQVKDVNNVIPQERAAVEETTCKVVKAALLISGVDKQRYGKLRDELANNYLLGTDQYPDTFDKGVRTLGNYQMSRFNPPFKANPDNMGVEFLQQGSHGGRGGCSGCRRGAGRGKGGNAGADAGSGGSVAMSAITGASGGEVAARTNLRGKNCSAGNHWAYKCPQSNEQQAQLHMNLKEQGETEVQHEEGHQLLNMTLAQAGDLPEN
jgi:hypothetical protein